MFLVLCYLQKSFPFSSRTNSFIFCSCVTLLCPTETQCCYNIVQHSSCPPEVTAGISQIPLCWSHRDILLRIGFKKPYYDYPFQPYWLKCSNLTDITCAILKLFGWFFCTAFVKLHIKTFFFFFTSLQSYILDISFIPIVFFFSKYTFCNVSTLFYRVTIVWHNHSPTKHSVSFNHLHNHL